MHFDIVLKPGLAYTHTPSQHLECSSGANRMPPPSTLAGSRNVFHMGSCPQGYTFAQNRSPKFASGVPLMEVLSISKDALGGCVLDDVLISYSHDAY